MQQPRARTPLKSFPDHRKLLNGGFSDYKVLFIFMLCLSACQCCPQAQLYMGGLSPQPPLPILGEKLHQVFHNVLENLQNVMNGYCLPEPYFSAKVRMFSPLPVKNQAWEKSWLGISWLVEDMFLTFKESPWKTKRRRKAVKYGSGSGS